MQNRTLAEIVGRAGATSHLSPSQLQAFQPGQDKAWMRDWTATSPMPIVSDRRRQGAGKSRVTFVRVCLNEGSNFAVLDPTRGVGQMRFQFLIVRPIRIVVKIRHNCFRMETKSAGFGLPALAFQKNYCQTESMVNRVFAAR